MNIDSSAKLRIFISAIVFSVLIFAVKLISELNPLWVYIIINLGVVISINRPNNIKESIVIGLLIGILIGIFLSILYLGLMVFAAVMFSIISIAGSIISYYIFQKIMK